MNYSETQSSKGTGMGRPLFGFLLSAALCLCFAGCRSVRPTETAIGPHFKLLTYNVNWGGPRPDLAADIIRNSGADIVCLQETTPEWAQYLRQTLGDKYSFTEFRDSRLRSGGGLGFLSKVPAHQVAYIPSDTGWFDGWIMAFDTANGPVQVLNVHLHPPVTDRGSWVAGYLTTRDDRLAEIERFFARRDPKQPTLVAGDFNDGENSPAVQWLEKNKMANALPQFDHYTKTWEWKTSGITLSRRMDHILYSPELHCSSAQVLRAGASDHFPVQAVFTPPTL
jgi:endonuclease/exonuclease/phosphatase family metal-dependent hydrolase